MSSSTGWGATRPVDRRADLVRFYQILATLEEHVGGTRRLSDCSSRMAWPRRGVYFFFEPGERRSDSGVGPRVVRVGTHALKPGSSSSLWSRLSQHRGATGSGGGNHRGSIFRLLVGTAIKNRDHVEVPRSWGVGSDPSKAAHQLNLTREQVVRDEHTLEVAVSDYLRSLPFLWIAVDDATGPDSDRGLLERHSSIGLLSNYARAALDPPSSAWLGASCDRERVRASGLWNNNHVDEGYHPPFLVTLERYTACMQRVG